MSNRNARRLAWTAFALWIAFFVVTAILNFTTEPMPGNEGIGTDWLFVLTTAAFPLVGIMILARQPRNPIGWILMGIGLGWSLPFGSYGDFAISRDLPGGAIAVAINGPTWAPPIVLMGTSLLLRFPNGQLLSPRWKKVEWVAAVAVVATVVAILLAPGKLAEGGHPELANPLGIEALEPFLNVITAAIVLIPLTILASAFSLIQRFRRSRGIERLQLKWLTSAAAFVAVAYLIAMIASIDHSWESPAENLVWVTVAQRVAVLSFMLIPIAIGIAILRYRLYDIDLVINKALVFGALAAFITALYVAIVVGVSALVGRAGEPNLALSLLATAVVAVAFQPARERAQRLANRLVYGQRATPYEVLSAFSAQAATTLASEEVLPRVARTVAEGTGADRSEVWVASGSQLRLAAAWPEPAESARPLRLENGRLPALPEVDLAVPVHHQAELLGALAVAKPRGEPLTPQEEKLLHDLAAQAGLVLRNVGLTAELLARLEELRASRQRLVSAQDAERRRLERDLHDGAQQHLVALKVKLALAARQAGETPLQATLAALQQDSEEAIEALRELARGIYPPLLAEQGLAAALEAQARKAPLPVTIEAETLARYPQELEAAVYFCCLEALQNVAKYANASQASVRLAEAEGELRFSVSDDGVGFDPATVKRGSGLQNMADRLEALGGKLEVESAPGEGTTVAGRIARHR